MVSPLKPACILPAHDRGDGAGNGLGIDGRRESRSSLRRTSLVLLPIGLRTELRAGRPHTPKTPHAHWRQAPITFFLKASPCVAPFQPARLKLGVSGGRLQASSHFTTVPRFVQIKIEPAIPDATLDYLIFPQRAIQAGDVTAGLAGIKDGVPYVAMAPVQPGIVPRVTTTLPLHLKARDTRGEITSSPSEDDDRFGATRVLFKQHRPHEHERTDRSQSHHLNHPPSPIAKTSGKMPPPAATYYQRPTLVPKT